MDTLVLCPNFPCRDKTPIRLCLGVWLLTIHSCLSCWVLSLGYGKLPPLSMPPWEWPKAKRLMKGYKLVPLYSFRMPLKDHLSSWGSCRVDWNLLQFYRGSASSSAPSCLLHFPTGVSLENNLFTLLCDRPSAWAWQRRAPPAWKGELGALEFVQIRGNTNPSAA